MEKAASNIGPAKWLAEAAKCEHHTDHGKPAPGLLTLQAVVKQTVGLQVAENDRLSVWMANAEEHLMKGNPAVARAIYAHLLSQLVKLDMEDVD